MPNESYQNMRLHHAVCLLVPPGFVHPWLSVHVDGTHVLVARAFVRCRFSLAVRIIANCFCLSLPSLGNIDADAKPEPVIEPGNATAIGQGHRHIAGAL